VDIGSVSAATTAGDAAAGSSAGPIPPLGFIAQQLGTSLDAVRAALAGGASIDDLARGRGVSPDALRQAVAAHVQLTRAQERQHPIESAVLARMLDRAFSQQRGGTGRHPSSVPAVRTAYADEDDSPPSSGAVSIYA
jgi:hypothetical protein